MPYTFFTLMDRSKEKSTVTLNLDALTAGGANYATLETAADALYTAIDDVTLGNIQERALVAERTRLTNVVPGTGYRERKLLVRYQDNTTLKVYTIEIPCINDAAFTFAPGTDFVDIGASSPPAAQTALLVALNTHVKSPVGNDITVISMEIVGRNN